MSCQLRSPLQGEGEGGCGRAEFDRIYPYPNLDETTSHSTKLANNASQVAGYPPARGKGFSLRKIEFITNNQYVM